ncbi:MAG: hypothetical protein WDO72_11970 [Pseudomonadota bacterium]
MIRKSFASTLFFGLLLASPAFAQVDQFLPPQGGEGGGRFVARCAGGDILTGFELRTGNDVDNIRPVCVSAYAPDVIGPRHAFSNGFGGSGGGGPLTLLCPDNAPAIAGLEIKYEGQDTVIVNNVRLYCSIAKPNQPLTNYPTAMFDGKQIHHTDAGPFTGYDPVLLYGGMQTCPAGLVPVGIHGRSGIWVDAVGLICGRLYLDSSKLPSVPVKSLGRVNTGTPSGPPKPICEAAREARARNSPAAPNLEKQCQAQQQQPVKSLGRVNTGSAPLPTRSICDAARDALARKSPAAPSLVNQCRGNGGNAAAGPANAELDAMSVRGGQMAASDELATMLLARLPDDPARRGFVIGLGIWEGNTAPGPGKQRYHDALTSAEQRGFDIAAAYSLTRNKYAALVGVGGAIAAADTELSASRSALEEDGSYWLGFDIASGLFGDPAAGAEGDRAMNAGAAAIRDTLNAGQQRGFDASMALHLSRSYP